MSFLINLNQQKSGLVERSTTPLPTQMNFQPAPDQQNFINHLVSQVHQVQRSPWNSLSRRISNLSSRRWRIVPLFKRAATRHLPNCVTSPNLRSRKTMEIRLRQNHSIASCWTQPSALNWKTSTRLVHLRVAHRSIQALERQKHHLVRMILQPKRHARQKLHRIWPSSRQCSGQLGNNSKATTLTRRLGSLLDHYCHRLVNFDWMHNF